MKNKLFIVLILVAVGIVVFYLIGPEKTYEEESYENPYSSICQKISKTN
jgi:hypothetical protein